MKFRTFSFSALIIYAIDGIKHSAAEKKKKGIVMYSFALLGAALLATVVCCFSPIDIDYGIAGVTLPVCVRLLDFRLDGASGRRLTAFYSLLLFSVNLLILTAIYGTVQSFCLFSLPLIMAYSGKRGKYNLKSAFLRFLSRSSCDYCDDIPHDSSFLFRDDILKFDER